MSNHTLIRNVSCPSPTDSMWNLTRLIHVENMSGKNEVLEKIEPSVESKGCAYEKIPVQEKEMKIIQVLDVEV